LAAGLAVLLAAHAVGDDGDDTLRFYLGKSDLVVVGTIASEPVGVVKEAGVVHYPCDVAVTDVLKGAAPEKPLRVNIIRFERDEADTLPWLKKGARCILFLKAASGMPAWQTADVWFGIQPESPWMVRSLKRLAR
jgi:hypothetical protein